MIFHKGELEEQDNNSAINDKENKLNKIIVKTGIKHTKKNYRL